MEWIAFSYSLPSKEGSSPRVMLWRRLRRLGVLAIAGGVQVLPANEECLEAFQWLAQEIRATNGEASVMRITRLEGQTDQQLIARFCAARVDDYHNIEVQAIELKEIVIEKKETAFSDIRDRLMKLRHRYSDIVRIDYFECSEGKRVASLLDSIEQGLSPTQTPAIPVVHVNIIEYKDKTWVTRPHPFVDRLSCAWLIRKYIDPKAQIRYSNKVSPADIRFDMDQGEFGHRGNLCTFEMMKQAFNIDNAPLQAIAEIVHAVDLHDEHYTRPEIVGIETILRGWSLSHLSDEELEIKGISLFDGLYFAFSQSH
jgi:hypothetical protein